MSFLANTKDIPESHAFPSFILHKSNHTKMGIYMLTGCITYDRI